MKRIKLFEQFINEGGWSSTKTQQTKLTPAVLKATNTKIKEFEKDFNSHLESVGLPTMNFIRAIGSGTWYEDDVLNNPDKIYGDIDYLVSYPLLHIAKPDSRKDEVESIKTYNGELFNFIESAGLTYIDVDETKGMSSLNSVKLLFIVEIDNKPEYIQADVVITHPPYEEWALNRYTPIRNVKGFVLGNMYSSLATSLGLSIQDRGVRGKFNKGILMPWSKRAGVEEKVISMDFNNFLHDIAQFFFDYMEKEGTMKPSKTLDKYRGINVDGLSMEDMAKAIRGLAETLEDNNLFGDILDYKDTDDFLKKVSTEYSSSMMKMYNASKFNKAETPAAIATVTKIRRLIDNYITIIHKLF